MVKLTKRQKIFLIHYLNKKEEKEEKNNMLEIKIKYLADIDPIEQQHEGEWYDLRCAEDMALAPNQFYYLPLGVAIKLPDGYEAIMAPRSSAFKNFGILQTNGIGVIDALYSGDNDEWKMPVYATRPTVIKKSDRICQFRIQKQQPEAVITKVAKLGNKDRGGLGSTGIK